MHQAAGGAVLGQQQDPLAALAAALQPLQAVQGAAAVPVLQEALGPLQEALADPAVQAHNPVLAHAVQQLAQVLAAQAGAEQAGPAAQHLAQVLIAQAQAGGQGGPAGVNQQLSVMRHIASRTMEPHLHFLARLPGLGELTPDDLLLSGSSAGADAHDSRGRVRSTCWQPAASRRCCSLQESPFKRQAGTARA